MQRQKLTINFDLKSRTQATFVYKRGEIDKNGVEVELTNINVTNATGQVRIKDPEGNSLEPGIVTVNESKATFTLPTYLTGTWEFEVRIFNDNGTTISSTYSYSVLESLDTDDASLPDYESAWDVWTKNEATRVSNESARTTAESTRASNENTRISNETKRQASITDIEKRFSNLTTAQQQQAEVVDARTDYNGVEHDSLKTRLDNDYETLASLIPTDIAFDGYESVTTNDTLSGDVKNTTLTGQTLVNLANTLPTSAQAGASASFDEEGRVVVKQSNYLWSGGGLRCGEFIKPSTVYTLYFKFKNTGDRNIQPFHLKAWSGSTPTVAPNEEYSVTRTVTTIASVTPSSWFFASFYSSDSIEDTGNNSATSIVYEVVILEGDHTDKPLEFFEGLKSAELSEVESTNTDKTKSSKTTLSEPITLRSLPNGVADTYDVDTGVLTRRCGEREYQIDDETNVDVFTDLAKTVYKLSTPTTEYIENNGQLRSYDYQTTVSADSIVPVKLSGNIPVNYASTLNALSTKARELKLENLSLIEQAESLSEQLITANETNDYQDSLIDVSLLATDELYTLIEPLLPELFSNTKGGNAMVDAYVAMVIKGLKTIDQVPSRYREEVKRVLAELEK